MIIAERWLESRRIGEAVRVDGRGDDGAQRPMEARKGSRLVAVGGRGDGAGGAQCQYRSTEGAGARRQAGAKALASSRGGRGVIDGKSGEEGHRRVGMSRFGQSRMRPVGATREETGGVAG